MAHGDTREFLHSSRWRSLLGCAGGARPRRPPTSFASAKARSSPAAAFSSPERRGYFKRLGIDMQIEEVQRRRLAVPALISGELDISLMTANASLFNSIAKGAPLVIMLDRGHNRPGFGYPAINVTQELYDQGVRSLADFASSRARRSASARSAASTNTTLSRALQKAGLDPAQGRAVDHQRAAAGSHEDARAEAGRRHRSRLPVRLLRAEQQVGPDVATGDEVDPDGSISRVRRATRFPAEQARRRGALRHGLSAGREGVQRRGRGSRPSIRTIVEILAKQHRSSTSPR